MEWSRGPPHTPARFWVCFRMNGEVGKFLSQIQLFTRGKKKQQPLLVSFQEPGSFVHYYRKTLFSVCRGTDSQRHTHKSAYLLCRKRRAGRRVSALLSFPLHCLACSFCCSRRGRGFHRPVAVCTYRLRYLPSSRRRLSKGGGEVLDYQRGGIFFFLIG